MSSDWIFPTCMALAGTVVLHVGVGIQKAGVKHRAWAIWTLGAAMAFGASILGFYALSLGLAISVLAAFAGVGLLTLLVFARLVLREDVARAEFSSLGLIIVGTVLAGLPRAGPAIHTAPSLTVLLILSILISLPAAATVLLQGSIRAGVFQAILAGVTGGLGIAAQKAVVVNVGSGRVAAFAIWLGLSLVSMIMTTLAFRTERAAIVVPVGAASAILTGAATGAFLQGEVLGLAGWSGVLLTALGVTILAIRSKPEVEAAGVGAQGA